MTARMSTLQQTSSVDRPMTSATLHNNQPRPHPARHRIQDETRKKKKRKEGRKNNNNKVRRRGINKTHISLTN